MADEQKQVTFELLARIGTDWQTQGVYKASEEMQANADARALVSISTIQEVKLVREVYDPASNQSQQRTIFENKRPKPPEPELEKNPPVSPLIEPSAHQHVPSAQPAPVKSAGAGPSAAVSRSELKREAERKAAEKTTQATEDKKKSKKSGRHNFFIVVIQLLVSFCIALIVAWATSQITSYALRDMNNLWAMSKDDIIVGVFVLFFVLTSVILVRAILTRTPLNFDLASTPPSSRKSDHALRQKIAEEEKAMRAANEAAQAAQSTLQQSVNAEGASDDVSSSAPMMQTEQVDSARPSLASLHEEVKTLDAFTDDFLRVLNEKGKTQDAYTIFGMSLFMSGSIYTLQHEWGLNNESYQRLLAHAFSRVGLSGDRFESFLARTQEYLTTDSRYAEMFQSGRISMGAYLANDASPSATAQAAFKEWSKPKPKAKVAPVAILFTDIAGSTAMTQRLGDAAAQEVVRAHNTVVRDALAAFNGQEIKHTGDGIMASFPSVVSSVRAAIQMQHQAVAYRNTTEDRPLSLKIGLNAGEPISEDDDLFGATVQMAARIVDKAGSDEILVSAAVHGLAEGKGIVFEPRGEFAMKGFDNAVSLFEVKWNAPTPQADAESAETASQPMDEDNNAVAMAAPPADNQVTPSSSGAQTAKQENDESDTV